MAQRYEYGYMTTHSDVLKEKGREGWRLVPIPATEVQIDGTDEWAYAFLMERPIPDSDTAAAAPTEREARLEAVLSDLLNARLAGGTPTQEYILRLKEELGL